MKNEEKGSQIKPKQEILKHKCFLPSLDHMTSNRTFKKGGKQFQKRRMQKRGGMEVSINLNMSYSNCNQYNKDKEIDGGGRFNNDDCQQNSVAWKEIIEAS
jgi:hypothetical protein